MSAQPRTRPRPSAKVFGPASREGRPAGPGGRGGGSSARPAGVALPYRKARRTRKVGGRSARDLPDLRGHWVIARHYRARWFGHAGIVMAIARPAHPETGAGLATARRTCTNFDGGSCVIAHLSPAPNPREKGDRRRMVGGATPHHRSCTCAMSVALAGHLHDQQGIPVAKRPITARAMVGLQCRSPSAPVKTGAGIVPVGAVPELNRRPPRKAL